MTIRDMQKYIDTLWDWGEFDDCFSGNIKITDIDGCVERNNHFLFIETKLPDQEIPRGQEILFKRLAQLPNTKVLVIWGKPNQPEAVQFIGQDRWICDNAKRLHWIIASWFETVDKEHAA